MLVVVLDSLTLQNEGVPLSLVVCLFTVALSARTSEGEQYSGLRGPIDEVWPVDLVMVLSTQSCS